MVNLPKKKERKKEHLKKECINVHKHTTASERAFHQTLAGGCDLCRIFPKFVE